MKRRLGAVFVGIGLVTLIGYVAPSLIISTGLKQLSGRDEFYARFALERADANLDRERMVVRKLRVVSVRDSVEPPTHEVCDEISLLHTGETLTVLTNFRVHVRAYTWFGIPYRDMNVECNW